MEMMSREFPYTSRTCKWIVGNLLNDADFVTGCSAEFAEGRNQISPKIQNKSLPIPNGIDMSEFELKKNYFHSRPYLFSIGRFVHKKGFDILIKAFKEVSGKNPDIDLIIGGTGEEWQECALLVEKLGLQMRVKMPGLLSREDVISLYNGCTFFVLPSRREPFGITNLEAMAAGKAIIAADVGGVQK